MLEDLGRENVMINVSNETKDMNEHLKIQMNQDLQSSMAMGNHNRRKHSIDETSYIERFGEKMKKIRQSKGWTLKMAEEQGYPSWRHLSDIENGKKSVTIITVLRLSQLYELEPAELLRNI